MPEQAKGIPDRAYYGDIEKEFHPGDIFDLIIQEHRARKAGPHFDVRIGNKDTGLHSWVTKGDKPFPLPDGKKLAIEQPVHSYKYKDFEGEIPSGYGAGTVRKYLEDSVLISDVDKDKIIFTTTGRYPERFALIRTDDKNWLLINITPVEPVPPKRNYINVPHEEIANAINKITDSDTIEAKVDGALGVFKILKNRLEILSHRKSKISKRPIFYTEKFFGFFPKLENKNLNDTVFVGEVYAVRETDEGEEQALSSNELSGILNSTLKNALDYIRSENIKFKAYVFDILRYKGKDIDWNEVPYSERLKMIESLTKELNQQFNDKFQPPVYVFGKDKAWELWNKLKEDKRLYTDGIVIWPEKGKPKKLKFYDETDVYIVDIIPENSARGLAGGIVWSYTPNGEPMGIIGTGMDHKLKKDMLEHPEDYIGRVMKVKFLEKTKAGKLRAPVFISLHEEKTAGYELSGLEIKRWNLLDFSKIL